MIAESRFNITLMRRTFTRAGFRLVSLHDAFDPTVVELWESTEHKGILLAYHEVRFSRGIADASVSISARGDDGGVSSLFKFFSLGEEELHRIPELTDLLVTMRSVFLVSRSDPDEEE